MLRHTRTAIAILLLIGCGSSAAPKDASGIGGSVGTGAGGTTGDGGLTGIAGLTGGGGQGGMAPATPTGSLVFTGVTAVLDCTAEEGATGDRWCAFLAASVSAPNNIELHVVNISAAARGTSITCGLADANCLRLTDRYTEDDLHLGLFGGDTLVYHDDTWTPFGWRPGMTAGRALAVADATTMDVLLCQPDAKGTGVTCLRALPMAMQTDPTNMLLGDVLAGRIDAAATPPLARVETVIAASAADGNIGHFQMGFPVPGGDTVAWSARAIPGGPEVLKVQTLGNDASRVTVASDVTGWSASPDGVALVLDEPVQRDDHGGDPAVGPLPRRRQPGHHRGQHAGVRLPDPHLAAESWTRRSRCSCSPTRWARRPPARSWTRAW